MEDRVAIVTGANKGLGFAIAKKLGEEGLRVIMGARDEDKGKQAAQELKKEGFNVEFRHLDIANTQSIQAFVDAFDRDYGKCDILVNNAGVAFKKDDDTPQEEQASETFKPNFFGTIELTEMMLPLLRKGNSPRIVNMASQAGLLKILPDKELKDRVTSDSVTLDELKSIAEKFIQDIEAGSQKENDWPDNNYGFSKLMLIAYTKELARRESKNGILVNACSPGYVDTDMTSHEGTRTPEEGASTPVYLALLKPDDHGEPTGKFFYDKKEISWEEGADSTERAKVT